MKKEKSLPTLINECQRLFNEYTRLRDLAGCDHFKCIACGQIKDKKYAHASHYYNVGHYSGLRFDFDNCHIGCSHCNTFLHGNLIEYRDNLLFKIGAKRFEMLKIKALAYKRSGMKFSRYEIEEKIAELKQKIRELK
jgi:hypothetical protein